jgi:hypothetical protein
MAQRDLQSHFRQEETDMLKSLALAVLLSAIAGLAHATCVYQGVVYPEGAHVGPFVCSGGQWIR